MTPITKIINKYPALPFLILLVLGFTVFGPALHGEFVSDDGVYIFENPAIKDISDLKAIWESFNTRFLPGLTFALNYHFGGLNVFGYHLVNLLCHILTAYLVYYFIRLTFLTPTLKETPLARESGSVAFFASLIFLTHPVQTQAAVFVAQRLVLFATASYVLTVICYARARLTSQKRYYWAGLIAMMIGMFSKENIFTVPVAVCLYELFFFSGDGRRWGQRLRPALPFFLLWLLLPIVFLISRPEQAAIDLKAQMAGRFINWDYFFTEINVLRTYLRLLLIPVNLIHEYDYPIARGFWQPGTVYSICLHLALLGSAFYLFKKNRVFSFCIFWFYITTSVEAIVVSIVNINVIYEHWLYLPMVGFAFFLAYAVHAFFKNRQRMAWAAVLLIALYATGAHQRSQVWRTELGFWQDTVKKSPGRPSPHFALGRAWEFRGRLDLAEQEYLKALSINPEYDQALNNLSGIYLKRGDHVKAKELLMRIISFDPDFGKAYNNMAYIHYLEGDDRRALDFYEQSLARQGPYPEAHFYMGRCWLNLGQPGRAQEHLEKALALHIKRKEHARAKEVRLFLEDSKSSP